ncbi:MAG: FMN-binding protein [Candidatus Marinimicrobia bacterium]|nr:FMN-binding protein [Candidatus Neomarinimicrobiota bacterium]MCF7850289.1 FMN-binding protein [Candidatus Neomarinimicrobiota bacterium]MCF7903814.1 FMN-binding protein [Candidatus Neomarinimicrobiota bacterium]
MLEKTGRRWLRVIHIFFIASLTGGLASILTINLIGNLDPRELYIANYSIYALFNRVVTYSFFGVVATGIVYSVFTHWGLTRHWWIIGKWTGTVLLFLLVWVVLGPAINGMVALSDIGLDNLKGSLAYTEYHGALAPAIIAALVIIAVLISITIFRPWGQRVQKHEMRRSLVLTLTGVGVILGVSLGIMGYLDLESYRKMEISTPDLSQISDGSYEGIASYAGFDYSVQVLVIKGKISDIKVKENRESPYARFAEGVIDRILIKQTPNVDAITGATTTSKCLMKAVEIALEGASE